MSAPADGSGEVWDLENLARARRLGDWMFSQYAAHAVGDVAEVGAGIGTFSARLLDAGVGSLLALEPEEACARRLECAFATEPRVTVARETLPGSPALEAKRGQLDFVLCQNVLEHIAEHEAAVDAMARALRPGGHLTILVPAHPRLFGNLDRAYEHCRRYTRAELCEVIAATGLELTALRSFNLLGVPGWWLQGRRRAPRISSSALRAYELLVRGWRPLEERLRPPWGLSLIAHARRGDT